MWFVGDDGRLCSIDRTNADSTAQGDVPALSGIVPDDVSKEAVGRRRLISLRQRGGFLCLGEFQRRTLVGVAPNHRRNDLDDDRSVIGVVDDRESERADC